MYQPNATAVSLLGFLMDGPKTGYELNREADERIGNFWNITRSQVYKELKNLEDAALVTAGEPGKRDSRQFTITETGERAFRTWILRDPSEEHIRFPMLLNATFMQHMPQGAFIASLKEYEHIHQKRLEEYNATARHLDTTHDDAYFPTVIFGQDYERMVLAWIRSTIATLETRR